MPQSQARNEKRIMEGKKSMGSSNNRKLTKGRKAYRRLNGETNGIWETKPSGNLRKYDE